jgi:hypothetical protein
MYIKNRKLATCFRALLVIVCLCGVILNVSALGSRLSSILSYFTIQSNIAVLLFFAGLMIYTWHRGSLPASAWYSTVKGCVTLCITVTFLVFHFILRPTLFSMSASVTYVFSPANFIVHYVVPIMTIADWLLFEPKGGFRKTDPLKWLIAPLAYLIFVLIGARFGIFSNSGSRYPYFFLDIDKYGAPQIALNCLAIGICFAALGYLIYFIDLGLSKRCCGNHKRQ